MLNFLWSFLKKNFTSEKKTHFKYAKVTLTLTSSCDGVIYEAKQRFAPDYRGFFCGEEYILNPIFCAKRFIQKFRNNERMVLGTSYLPSRLSVVLHPRDTVIVIEEDKELTEYVVTHTYFFGTLLDGYSKFEEVKK